MAGYLYGLRMDVRTTGQNCPCLSQVGSEREWSLIDSRNPKQSSPFMSLLVLLYFLSSFSFFLIPSILHSPIPLFFSSFSPSFLLSFFPPFFFSHSFLNNYLSSIYHRPITYEMPSISQDTSVHKTIKKIQASCSLHSSETNLCPKLNKPDEWDDNSSRLTRWSGMEIEESTTLAHMPQNIFFGSSVAVKILSISESIVENNHALFLNTYLIFCFFCQKFSSGVQYIVIIRHICLFYVTIYS